MSKNRKISSLEFDYLKNLTPYIHEDGYKSFKFTILDAIEGVFGDKWFNLKANTRQAIDNICFLSLERGFLWASPDYIAKENGIARSTVYEALKVLRQEGILYKANRTSKEQNGLGCSVHFFTIHPYFDHINSYLNLNWNAEQKADRKAENPEIPCGTRIPSDIPTPTLDLPSLYQKDFQNKDLQSNVSADANTNISTQIIKYVPKVINQLFAHVFGDRLRFIWQKITQAYKFINHSMLTQDDLYMVGRNIIKRLLLIWKEKMHSKHNMSLDEMCAFTYVSARESFYKIIAESYMVTYEEDMENYLLDQKNQFEVAKEEIPYLEDSLMRRHPYSSFERLRDAVIHDIKLIFPYLNRDKLSTIESNYAVYSAQTNLVREYYQSLRCGRVVT